MAGNNQGRFQQRAILACYSLKQHFKVPVLKQAFHLCILPPPIYLLHLQTAVCIYLKMCALVSWAGKGLHSINHQIAHLQDNLCYRFTSAGVLLPASPVSGITLEVVGVLFPTGNGIGFSGSPPPTHNLQLSVYQNLKPHCQGFEQTKLTAHCSEQEYAKVRTHCSEPRPDIDIPLEAGKLQWSAKLLQLIKTGVKKQIYPLKSIQYYYFTLPILYYLVL